MGRTRYKPTQPGGGLFLPVGRYGLPALPPSTLELSAADDFPGELVQRFVPPPGSGDEGGKGLIPAEAVAFHEDAGCCSH